MDRADVAISLDQVYSNISTAHTKTGLQRRQQWQKHAPVDNKAHGIVLEISAVEEQHNNQEMLIKGCQTYHVILWKDTKNQNILLLLSTETLLFSAVSICVATESWQILNTPMCSERQRIINISGKI